MNSNNSNGSPTFGLALKQVLQGPYQDQYAEYNRFAMQPLLGVPPMEIKKTSWLVALVGGNVVAAEPTEADAKAKAARMASKDDSEYLVLGPVYVYRAKPVDVEEVVL